MIKYKEIKRSDYTSSFEINKLKRKYPIKFIDDVGFVIYKDAIIYSIPFKGNWIYHNSNGYARIYKNKKEYYYYGYITNQYNFYDDNWRKRAEIKRFL